MNNAAPGPGKLRFNFSIPIKSGIEFLPDALLSLKRQIVPWQCAILDASGDAGVAAMLPALGITPTHAYHQDHDAGQAAAIQEGWDHMDGEILGWLNVDDRLIPGCLTEVAALFAEHPEVDVVYGQACYLDSDGAFIGYFPSYAKTPENLPNSCTICQPAAFVRRRAVERIGGLNTSLHYTMDWDLWLRLWQAGCRFMATESVLAAVINHVSTKTNSGGKRRQQEIDSILSRSPRSIVDRLRNRIGQWLGEATLAGHPRPLSIYKNIKRRLWRTQPKSLPSFYYGLAPLSNEVLSRCVITMPPPASPEPARLALFSNSPGPFRLSLATTGKQDSQLLIREKFSSRTGLGGISATYKHTSPTSLLFNTAITATIDGPDRWQLVAVVIEKPAAESNQI